MFGLSSKKKYPFGSVTKDDDPGIQVHRFKRSAQKGLWMESLKFLRDIILIVAVFVLFGVFVAQPVVVDGESMVPELSDGERLLVNKLIYYKIDSFSWGRIERGDIVVFWFPKEPDKSFVKRVVGLPGETVEVRDGLVYIDGSRLSEPYINQEKNRVKIDVPAEVVDQHYYFVMGDNRDDSLDSRKWGLVPEKYIYGKAFFRYWRPSRVGFLEKGDAVVKGEEGEPGGPEDGGDGDPRASLTNAPETNGPK